MARIKHWREANDQRTVRELKEREKELEKK